jgi:hypothetical protein
MRHASASDVMKRRGLEGAQVVLGHKRANTAEIYAEKSASFAAKIAAEMG